MDSELAYACVLFVAVVVGEEVGPRKIVQKDPKVVAAAIMAKIKLMPSGDYCKQV